MLKGQYIFLRALEPADVDMLMDWENNTNNWLISGTQSPYSRLMLNKYITSVTDVYTDKQLRLVICLKESKQAIGCIDLFEIDFANLRAGLGILIADKAFRKKGYAADALDVLLNYVFSVLHLHQVYCNILTGNLESLALFKSRGFKTVGVKKEWIRQGDLFLDEILLQRVKSNE